MITKKPFITCGIETSCDETSVAVIEGSGKVLSTVISSQIKDHQRYGGVVPEMASRLHVRNITPVLEQALEEAEVTYNDLSLIAYTKGPGLLGALSIGVMVGKTLSFALNIPMVGINHIEGHIYANILDSKHRFEYPAIALIVSGGHTQLILLTGPFEYKLLGNTLDDAVGEAFDKSGRLLGLGYPGGPVIDKLAQQGNNKVFKFPRVKVAEPFDFSFSGLKTAAIKQVEEHDIDKLLTDDQRLKDFCASFQSKLVEELYTRTQKAAETYSVKQIVVAGGVSANSTLRQRIASLAENFQIAVPELKYCLDNGAMIAAAGYARYQQGYTSALDEIPKANLPLVTASIN